MIHEEIEHNIVPRRYVGASNRLRSTAGSTCRCASHREALRQFQRPHCGSVQIDEDGVALT